MENCCPLDIVSPLLEDVLNLDGQRPIYIKTYNNKWEIKVLLFSPYTTCHKEKKGNMWNKKVLKINNETGKFFGAAIPGTCELCPVSLHY